MSNKAECMHCVKCGTVQPEEAEPIRCPFCGGEVWITAAEYAASIADAASDARRDGD